MNYPNLIKLTLSFLLLAFMQISSAHPIDDFYNLHKNDKGMESKKIPPKMAAIMVDDDYPEAIDILKSLRSLKYLNFYGDENSIGDYASSAEKQKGNYVQLLDTIDGKRKIKAFGQKKKNKIKKIIVIVETPVQFVLIVAKGSLTDKQIKDLPSLSSEIQ